MNNLKYFRKKNGKTQTEISEYLGITQTAYGHYETGRRKISYQNILKLSRLYGVTAEELMGNSVDGKGWIEIKEQPELIPEEDVLIPLVASLRCGYGEKGQDVTFIKRVPIPASYIRRWGADLKCITAIGDSMSPTIIAGDILVCRQGEEWEDGNVVIVNINDSDTIKRIYRTSDGGIDLVPDNKAYNTMHFTLDEIDRFQVHVLGRVMIPIPKEL